MAHVALGKIFKMCNEMLSLMARNRSSEQASLLVRATPGKTGNNVLAKKKGVKCQSTTKCRSIEVQIARVCGVLV